MPFDWIQKAVQSLAGKGLSEIILSTMGEPMLYSHIESVLMLLKQTGVKLNLTTNGTFPAGGVDFWIPKLLPVLSDIKFSIQAISPEVNREIMCGIDAEQQQDNILRFIEARNSGDWKATISLQITAQKGNVGELNTLLRWAVDHCIDRIKVNRVRVHHQYQQEMIEISDQQWNDIQRNLQQLQRTCLRSDGVPIQLVCQGLGGYGQAPCPFLGKEIWVMQDGEIRFCPHPTYFEAFFPQLGYVPESLLRGIRFSEAYESFLVNYERNSFCQNCSFRLNLES